MGAIFIDYLNFYSSASMAANNASVNWAGIAIQRSVPPNHRVVAIFFLMLSQAGNLTFWLMGSLQSKPIGLYYLLPHHFLPALIGFLVKQGKP